MITSQSVISALDGRPIEGAFEALKEKYISDLFLTAKGLLGYPDINWRTHGGTIEALESSSQRKLICLPRGCLKSTLACVAYPIWLLLKNPNLRILIDSELYTNSTTFLREIKAHLANPKLAQIFGQFKGALWNESEVTINQRTQKTLKEASITCGGIGTTKVGQHYDVIIGDDYNSPNNSNTPENAAKVVNHYRYNISILENKGTYVIIGTRYSEADIIGHVFKEELGLDVPQSGEFEPMVA
jgi:hypothetical protein